jgi:peptide/nickel transport system substrate-binding protein
MRQVKTGQGFSKTCTDGAERRSLAISVTRISCAVLASMALFVVLASCVRERSREVDQNIFRYNEPDGIASLDPTLASYQAAIWATGHLYNGLVELDTALAIAPCLASHWEVDAAGTRYTFHLRTDVWFHHDACFGGKGLGQEAQVSANSSRRVVASDVVFSIRRVFDGSTRSTGAWVYRDRVKDIVAIDDSTLQISLKEPFAPFLAVLTMPYGYVIPHEAVEFYGADFGQHPVGTGPFAFAGWKPDVALELRRNPLYFKRNEQGTQLPYLDGIRIGFLRDTKSEFLEFLHGGMDMVTSVDEAFANSVYDVHLNLLEPYKHLRLQKAPAMSVEYYGILLDTTKPAASRLPLARSKKLRQALNYAIDRHRIVTYVLHGRGIPSKHGFLPPSLPGYEDSVGGYGFDQDRARQLLGDAGFPNGKGLPTLLLQLGNNQRTASVAEAAQAMWKEIGVNVELRRVDFPQHLSQVRAGELPMWRTSWIGDYPDPENFLALFTTANRAPGGPNTTHLCSPHLDSLYKAALNPGLTFAQRTELYSQMQAEVVDQAPWIFLYHDVLVRLTHQNIKGFRTDATGRLQLEAVRKQ